MVAAAVEEEEIKPPKKKVQKKRHRCWSCKKKVGILGFECKCDYVFCSKHRYASAHDCDFDYKEANQNIIKKLNPQVKREKFERI